MIFSEEQNVLTVRNGHEILIICGWGTNGLRVRTGLDLSEKTGFLKDKALTEICQKDAIVEIFEDMATVTNGKLECRIDRKGHVSFYRDGVCVLSEYAMPLGLKARDYGFDGRASLRFIARKEEKIYGMGQYQQDFHDLKGCHLELAQRNTQMSVPFYLSSLGYGFLWNHAGIGDVMFGSNYTEWNAIKTDSLDYWITADDSPKAILANYTEVTGRASAFPRELLGLWQCKLRYRSQEEVLAVAREYNRRQIPLDVIIIDFFHWPHQGDFCFDPNFWPDPKAMTDELHAMGIKCFVSVWPTVESKSENYAYMEENGMLIRNKVGLPLTMRVGQDSIFYDATDDLANRFVWSKLKANYRDYGIDGFWLDVAEPEYHCYDWENYAYSLGDVVEIGNVFPKCYAKMVYDGMRADNCDKPVSLIRCAWVGSAKYGALAWSGDVRTSFASLRNQVQIGIHIGLAGIPWWNTDIGGFCGNAEEPNFKELLIRWFEYAVYTPVLRMHGDRRPRTEEYPCGLPNELWAYGDDVLEILRKHLDRRLAMLDYLDRLMSEASENGSPLIRAMFYEFPDDPCCWTAEQQYMFGDRYLVAPVTDAGCRERTVYLPAGSWKQVGTGEMFRGGQSVMVAAPLDEIPVFERVL